MLVISSHKQLHSARARTPASRAAEGAAVHRRSRLLVLHRRCADLLFEAVTRSYGAHKPIVLSANKAFSEWSLVLLLSFKRELVSLNWSRLSGHPGRGQPPVWSSTLTKKKQKRKRHTDEFRAEVLRAVETRGQRTIGEVAASLGVSEGLIHTWKGKASSRLLSAIEAKRWSKKCDGFAASWLTQRRNANVLVKS
jgi:hypothetical protein